MSRSRMTTVDPPLTIADVAVGDELPPLSYDVTATTVVARCARDPRLAAAAPRLPVRHRAQRRQGHLPQLAQPARLVRALRHRLERTDRPARPAVVPDDRLDLPRRHDGVHRDRDRGRHRRHRLRLGRRRHRGQGRRQASARRARAASPCPPPPTTTPGLAAASAGTPDQERTSHGHGLHSRAGHAARLGTPYLRAARRPRRRPQAGERPGRLLPRAVDRSSPTSACSAC